MYPTSTEYSVDRVSVFNNTYNYLNEIISYMVACYNRSFQEDGIDAEVMHRKEVSDGGQIQKHLFYRSDTNTPLFGIIHYGNGNSYLLV